MIRRILLVLRIWNVRLACLAASVLTVRRRAVLATAEVPAMQANPASIAAWCDVAGGHASERLFDRVVLPALSGEPVPSNEVP